MIDPYIPVITAAAGGMFAGNLFAKFIGRKKVSIVFCTLIGLIGGVAGQLFLGPEIGPMIGATGETFTVLTIVSNLAAGAIGGGVLGMLWGVLRRIF